MNESIKVTRRVSWAELAAAYRAAVAVEGPRPETWSDLPPELDEDSRTRHEYAWRVHYGRPE